ncbi:MAG: ribonuclease E/G [Pseudomonadota bacterium]
MKGSTLVFGRHADSGAPIAALTVDGRLENLAVDPPNAPKARAGAVFVGRVSRSLSQGGAFLDLGAGEIGFLVDPHVDARDLAEGDAVLAQVLNPAEDGKAARLSLSVQIKDRLLVFTPMRSGVNASRQIGDQALRRELTEALAPFQDEGGFILRTAAARATRDEIVAAAERLVAEWREAARVTDPALVRPAPHALEIAATDWPRPDIVVTDADASTRDLVLADARHRPVDPGQYALEELGVAEALEELFASECALPHGWMALQRTEALIAIDVNAGDASSRLPANLAAAREIPRQLRLRGWGGMVLIDFAGRDAAHRERLEAALRQSAARDGVKIAGWGPLGLLEATRRRSALPIETVLRRRAT